MTAGGTTRNPSAPVDPRLRRFEMWLQGDLPYPCYVYHAGTSIARDKQIDPDLARLADRVLEVSTGEFDLVSRCGHVRGHLTGSGQVELCTRRAANGERLYLARRRGRTAA